MEAPVLRVEVKLRVLDSPTMMMKKEVGSSRANRPVCSDRHTRKQEHTECSKAHEDVAIAVSYARLETPIEYKEVECCSVLLAFSFAFDTGGIERKFEAATGRWCCCSLRCRW